MKQFGQIFRWWLTALFFIAFTASGAWATKMTIGPVAHIADIEPTTIGKTQLVPIQIDFLPAGVKSGYIKFELDPIMPLQVGVDPNSVKIERVTLDLSKQTPYVVYVPVTVTGDGRFDFEGTLRIDMVEGEKVYGEDFFNYPLSTLGIFAFDGEVFLVRGSSESAIRSMAYRNLIKNNSEFSKLLDKREKIINGLLKGQTFSQEEEDILYKLSNEATDQLYRSYYSYHPVKPKRESRVLRQPLQQNDAVTLTINWSIDSSYTSFLPLNGAQIAIIDNNNSDIISSGTVINGNYNFIVPRDNLSFTAKVTAKYGNDFTVRHTNGTIVEIGFQDADIFNIAVVENNASLLGIDKDEANAWSVFQALVELQERAAVELGVSKKPNYVVEIAADGTDYSSSENKIRLVARDSFDWDVIAHEFGHAIAHETGSTLQPTGGPHVGGNQYDYSQNSYTYHNKERSLALAFNEGYGTWIGVSLLENSAYKGKMPRVGDGIYQDTDDSNLNINLESNSNSQNAFGEDTEFAVASLLWDLTDGSNEANNRAICKNGCKDAVSIPLRTLFQNTLRGKNIRNISDFYGHLYGYHAGSQSANAFGAIGGVNPTLVEKTHQLGAIFAEFGIAANINENDNPTSFSLYSDANPPTIVWKQLKSGGLPYLDTFEILFFNKAKSELLYKISANANPASNNKYSYTLSEEEFDGLKNVLKRTYPTEIIALIKGAASGTQAIYGKIATGPYFGNLATIKISDEKYAVIAVDSSGSNGQTDPSNLRIIAAHKMLSDMAARNKEILESNAEGDEKPTSVAALDFDSGTRVLADFSTPEELYQRRVFNAIDSNGGTDIASAINKATDMLSYQEGGFAPFPNKQKIYVLTDMENGGGLGPVISAIQQAGYAGITVNIGHLSPLATRSMKMSVGATEINGDPINVSGDSANSKASLLKSYNPFDDVIEAILMTGGSYALIQNAKSQEAWVELMNYFNLHDIETVSEIPLPFDIQFYGLAKSGRDIPTFLVTPNESGMVTITVDSKGNFVPNLRANGIGTQEDLGNDIYKLKFMAMAGKTYGVTLDKSLYDVGLYNIVANIEAIKPSLFKGSLITTGATLDENGDVYVWGFRGSAQQGNGKKVVSNSAAPAKVASLSNVVSLTGGAYHLIALDANGDVWGWGQSGYGEIGCKHTIGIYVDTPCKVIGDITQVSAGEYFTVALGSDGRVYTWGHNLYGQLGDGNSKNSDQPVSVNLNGEKARLIGGAYEGAFAVTEEGRVYAWGDNEASGLGFKGSNYGVQKIVRTPTHIVNLDKYANDIVYIGGGNGWGEALLNDGTVIGWGLEASLGQGTTRTSISSPEPVVILHNVKQLFARYVGSIALDDEGTIYTWGQTSGSAFKNIYGEYATPHKLSSEVVEIGGGKEHIFYRTEDGSLYGVGYNDIYKLNTNKSGGSVDWEGAKIEFK